MKNKLVVLSCCFLLVLTTACGKTIPKTKDGEEIIASVDGKDFTVDELYKEMKTTYGYSQLINMIDLYIADKEIETTDEVKENAEKIAKSYVDAAKQYGVELEVLLSSQGLYNVTTEEELVEYFISSSKVDLAIEKQIASTITDKEIENKR